MKKLLSIITVAVVLLAFTGCGASDDAYDSVVAENEKLKQQINGASLDEKSSNVSDMPEDDVSVNIEPKDSVADPVKYEAHKTPTGELVVIVENTSGSTIADLHIEVVFLDTAGKMLSVGDDGHDAILPNEKVVSVFNDLFDTCEFDSYEITFKTEDYKPYKNISKEFVVVSNVGSNGVVAKFTNNSAILCEELEVVIVYYFNSEVVGAETEEKTDIQSGDSVTINFGTPTDSNYDRIQFDDYKIFFNQAHNFN